MCYSIAPLLVDFMSLRHFIADFIPVLTSVQQIPATSEKFKGFHLKQGGSGQTKHPLSEECTLVFVSAAQFVFVTAVTFISYLLSRFTGFSCGLLCFEQISVPSFHVTFCQHPIKRVVNDQVLRKTFSLP